MSRRKQARPIRLLEDEDPANPAALPATNKPLDGPDPATVLAQEVIPEVLMCQRCQEQFTDVQEYLTHKAECEKKAIKHDDPAHSDPEDMVVSEEEDDEEEDETGGKQIERLRRHRQDAANNNSVNENSPEEETGEQAEFPFPVPAPAAPGHVTLEALQNTKVAVAQFAATAMANNGNNEAALQELAVLQSTLFTLQHQQVLQLQLINQLQHQLQIDRVKEEEEDGTPVSPPPSDHENDNTTPVESPPTPQTIPLSREPTPALLPPPIIQPMVQQPPPKEPLKEVSVPTSIPPQIQPPMCSISSSLASTIIMHSSEPTHEEPNTLDMLQKRAQEVLDNASQGLLATNLADELAFRKSKGSMSPYDSKGRNEPFFKHRCRYCGKVFGSDSALQIHIRSHTGERPYKCNVCGSRFTTKGNLKVHFQRHSQKFPHIKMNPNPVPEHLDKYHPPLLAQLGQQPSLSPGGPPPPPHISFPGGPFPPNSLPLYRPPGPPPPHELMNRLPPSPHRLQDQQQRLFPPHPIFMKREEQDTPADLSKPLRSHSPMPEDPCKVEDMSSDERRDSIDEKSPPINVPQIQPKPEPSDIENDPENEPEQERYSSPIPYDECSVDSKYSNEDMLDHRSPSVERPEHMQDEPENLSNRTSSLNIPLCISTGQRLPANFHFGQLVSSPPSSTSSGSIGPYSHNPLADITKDPSIYTNLLPRPGSNDNSWESLIEVTKTSETSKLQQLVDNIEHKLSDPNQCVICNRILSCKSALQMHYRTHTGERPFKCKICGRAFTTKGNLKTHMGVHRAKPPMRVLHQCPVCHKKFTNALVLQQHIRLHTGEPTDLTPEQIQAAEVKDFPSPGGFPGLPNSMHPFLNQGFSVPGLSPLGPGFPMSMRYDGKDEFDEDFDEDDDDDDDMTSNSENQMLLPPISSPPSDIINSAVPVNTMASQFSNSGMNCSAEDLCSNRTMTSTPPMQNGEIEKSPSQSVTSPESSEIRSSPNQISTTPVQIPRPPSSQQAGSPTPSECNSLGALDLTPKSNNQPSITSPGPSPGPSPSLFSAFGLLPPGGSSPLMTSALSSLTSSVLTTTSFSPLRLAVGPTGRGNTTCNLCFKTFACNSALEIHYRSHTKERPFKCTVCDRGFSTKDGCVCKQRRIQDEAEPWRARKRKPAPRKSIPSVFPLPMSPGYASNWMHMAGNMKQHMLTHKIRDMPPHMFDNKPSSMSGDDSTPLPPSTPLREQPSSDGEQQHPHQPHTPQPQPQPQPPLIQVPQPPPPQCEIKPDPQPIKREPTETELPLSKRPPSLQASKHLCHVCNKNFSSSSALQIHMRTHTGDKPFRCTVCQKAFTTKGNLKVHMGTHMWSNGASRRGRRMSLDLPPIPMTPKDSEFLQRRPDLFYPYLPAPFLNGMQQKLNEMSVIQNNQNGISGAGKYSGLLGFGYPPPEALRSQAGSPERNERPPSRDGESRGLWDLHFERKNAPEPPREDLLPASREGLAA